MVVPISGRGLLLAGLCAIWMILLVLPVGVLGFSVSGSDLLRAFSDPRFVPALVLSLQTTLISLAWMLVLGTPVAWMLARSQSWWSRVLSITFELPIVIPPAVVGLSLLLMLGRRSLLGGWLESMGVSLAFESSAVVLAQVVVASPFYVQGAKTAFLRVSNDGLDVAQSLGASPFGAFTHVALPVALPGLATAASLAFARALGEFGATLLFAGNRVGHTQTMPLAIFSALESDISLAVVFALVLAATGLGLLLAVSMLRRRAGGMR